MKHYKIKFKEMKTLTAEETLIDLSGNINKDQFEEWYGIPNLSESFFVNAMHQFATQQSAIAVAKRDEELREWSNKIQADGESHSFQLGFHYCVGLLKSFLSTPSVLAKPTSAEIAQVELTNEAKSAEWRKINLSTKSEPLDAEPSIRVSELEELRDKYKTRINRIETFLPYMRGGNYGDEHRYKLEFIENLDKIINSKTK